MVEEATAGSDEVEQDPYRKEIAAALEQDPQRIGSVWRQRPAHGTNAEKIRVALELETVGVVHNALGSIETLLKCKALTKGRTSALQRARMLRNFAKRHEHGLSTVTKSRLSDLATEHQRIADDDNAIAKEAKENEDHGQLLRKAGIYVYTLPHYIQQPVRKVDDNDSDSSPRTYLKVGMSKVDAKGRIQQQVTTALPEEPMILRLYVLEDAQQADYKKLEARMHRHLNAADHNQNRRRGAGKEWFMTHLTFVDSTAELLGLVRAHEHKDYPSELVAE